MATYLLLLLPILFAITSRFFFSQRLQQVAVCKSLILLALATAIYLNSSPEETQLKINQSVWFLTFFSNSLSTIFVVISAFALFVSTLCNRSTVTKTAKYHTTVFLLTSAMFGFFLAADFITMYVCLEASSFAMFVLLIMLGETKRPRAPFMFMAWSAIGSLCFLGAISYITLHTPHNMDIIRATSEIQNLKQSAQSNVWYAIMAFVVIRTAIFPLHSWLVFVNNETIGPGSILLSGAFVNMGYYVLLRLVVPGFKAINLANQNLTIGLSIVTIFYLSLLATKQKYARKTMIYSVVAHNGYIGLSIFALSNIGTYAAIYCIISNCLVMCGMFVVADIILPPQQDAKNIVTAKPGKTLTTFMIMISLSNIGAPFTAGFASKLTSMSATSASGAPLLGIMICLAGIITTIYTAKLVKQFLYPDHTHGSEIKPNKLEMVGLVTICILIFLFGIFPETILAHDKIANIIP